MNLHFIPKGNMSLPNYKIPLFDVDWTLLKGSNPVHGKAFDYALHNVYNQPTAFKNEINTEGSIDPKILIDVLKLHNISEGEAKNKIPQALKAMVNYFMKHINEGHYQAMPGVVNLLKELTSLGIPLGLLTGNVEEIGWEKVRKAGIKDYFTFGAFGSLAFKRVDLIPIAKQRLEKILNIKIPINNFVIVGDSPLDIACARAGNIEVIAVAAGVYKEHHLSEADLVVSSLEEKDKIIDFLKLP